VKTVTSTAASDDLTGDDTVVTDVEARPSRITTNRQATVLVTVSNPQSEADTDTVELELFGEVVNTRNVTVPAGGETVVEFVYNIVQPGTYTARVDDRTATVTVVEPAGSARSTSPMSTSTRFPGFGLGVTLVALTLAVLVVLRRE
jgi:PGF-CTERM protein